MAGVVVRLGGRLGFPNAIRRVWDLFPQRWRRRLKREVLLWRPSLYAMNCIRYEQCLAQDELEALVAKLDGTLDVRGDIIECGCFLCGTTVQMARHAQGRQSDKRIYACDTFEGFDPAEIRHEQGMGDATDRHDFTGNDLAYVRRKLMRLDVAERVVLVKGLFQETLETLAGPFCFAFIDCDLHDSMLYAARTVWSRLSPGGCCVFDDYGNDEYRGASRAIDAFLAEHAGTIQEHGRLCRKMYFATKAPVTVSPGETP